jgi:hypothetical protein
MKHQIRPVLFALIPLFAWFGHTGEALQALPSAKEAHALSLTATASKDKFAIGDPMLVTVTLTNTSDKDVVWQSERPDSAYRNFLFSLKTDDNPDLPSTAYHRRIRGKQLPDDPIHVDSGSWAFATLSPGQSVQFAVDLKRIFEFKNPGTFKLVVTRVDELNKITIHSKPIEIEVVP